MTLYATSMRKVKVLHNDIKSNNVVLDGCSIAEAEAVLIDFGKATHQVSPKIYHKPADTQSINISHRSWGE